MITLQQNKKSNKQLKLTTSIATLFYKNHYRERVGDFQMEISPILFLQHSPLNKLEFLQDAPSNER